MSEIINLASERATLARAARRADMLKRALPSPDTRRWVASRKAAVVAAVNAGVIDTAEVERRYGVSEEELSGWRDALGRHGVGGLRTTRVQAYRDQNQQV